MADLEKVIKGLRCLSNPYIQDMDERDCENCKYDNASCFLDVTADALSLLQAQAPRVMTWEELSALPFDTPVVIEENNDECGWNVFCGIDEENDVCFCGFKASADYYDLEEYGESWRCWTSRPTDEQREATPWN